MVYMMMRVNRCEMIGGLSDQGEQMDGWMVNIVIRGEKVKDGWQT